MWPQNFILFPNSRMLSNEDGINSGPKTLYFIWKFMELYAFHTYLEIRGTPIEDGLNVINFNVYSLHIGYNKQKCFNTYYWLVILFFPLIGLLFNSIKFKYNSFFVSQINMIALYIIILLGFVYVKTCNDLFTSL